MGSPIRLIFKNFGTFYQVLACDLNHTYEIDKWATNGIYLFNLFNICYRWTISLLIWCMHLSFLKVTSYFYVHFEYINLRFVVSSSINKNPSWIMSSFMNSGILFHQSLSCTLRFVGKGRILLQGSVHAIKHFRL